MKIKPQISPQRNRLHISQGRQITPTIINLRKRLRNLPGLTHLF